MPDAVELLEEGQRFERHGVLDRALESYAEAAEASADPTVVAEALRLVSRVHRTRSEWEPAIEAARRAQQVARDAGLDAAATEGVIAEANVFLCRGEFDAARSLFNDVLDATTEPRVRGIALQNIGSILAQQGQLGAAERAFGESFGCFHQAGYQRGEAIALNNHGRVALDRGDAAGAIPLLEQAIHAARAVEDAELIALATLNYAEALEARGDYRGAEEMASTALGYFTTAGNRWREIECLRRIGTINERCGDVADAERCYDRALRLAEEIGARQDAQVIRDCLQRLGARSRTAPSRR
jgi:tetratricopeptide (TPR) repeat protein